jgi:hypothetical protein
MFPTPLGYILSTKDTRQDIFLSPPAKVRHTVLFGKSGVGKTTLLRNMILSDIWQKAGVTVIDPHGSLIEEILSQIPKQRTNDVIYLKPADLQRAIGINIFERVEPIYQPLIVSSIVSTFKTIWATAWGQQTEYLLTNFCFALLQYPKPTTLLDILKLMVDKDFRDEVFSQVDDVILQSFYQTYTNVWDKEQRARASAPLLNKVSAFATNPLLRAVIGQKKNSFNFRDVLDSQKILLCDLSKGSLGEDIASLLGSLITTKLYLASLSRQDIPETKRVPHYFYIDEVHNFTHGIDLASILAEARKYRLALTVATQTLAQLRRHHDSIVPALFGNCGTLISFRVSGEDAEIIAKEFASNVLVSRFEELPDFSFFLKTLKPNQKQILETSQTKQLNGYPPLSATTFLPQKKETIIKTSFERFTSERRKADEWIMKRFQKIK